MAGQGAWDILFPSSVSVKDLPDDTLSPPSVLPLTSFYLLREIYFTGLAPVECGGWARSKSAGQASRLNTQGTKAARVQRLSAGGILSSGEASLSSIKTVTLLDEAHPHYGEESALLKVY